MMTGFILNLNILVKVPIRLPDGSYRDAECLLDTGFTGEMVLPAQDVKFLRLPSSDNTEADLADGSQVVLPTYKAVILWHGNERDVTVIAAGERPLVGLALLEGTALYAEIAENGKVLLQEIVP